MNRYLLRGGLVASSLLVILYGCSSTGEKPTMTVGLAYAKTDGNNYINTGDISFGTLYVWDRSAKTLNPVHIYDQYGPSDLANPMPNRHQEHNLSDGFTVDFGGTLPVSKDNAAFKARYNSAISSESTVVMDNVTTQRYRETYKFLNAPATAATRAEMGKEFGSDRDNFRFVFVWGQLLADTADFRIGTGKDREITLDVPGRGNIAVRAIGKGVNFAKFHGKGSPVLLEMQVLKLIPSPQTEMQNGTGWRFVLDTENSGKLLTDLLRGAHAK